MNVAYGAKETLGQLAEVARRMAAQDTQFEVFIDLVFLGHHMIERLDPDKLITVPVSG